MEKHRRKVEFHNFCKTTKNYNTSILTIIAASVTAACKFQFETCSQAQRP